MKVIRHVGIVVSNLDTMFHFYKNVLGLKIINERNERGEFIDNLIALKGVKVKTIKMSTGGGALIELLYFESHPGGSDKRSIYGRGYSHLAFTIADADYEYARLRKIGIKFNSAPQMSPDGKTKVIFCQDPEGNFIELVEELRAES
ncbi:MAG: VOC family protein [Candidatus Omnitrophica bacterium]|jgi:catechol 2,3-dioxygenase-like lactoylglutathione lyase family enzyme|nr:VOC family protein [Candidatus Omnitrophota bacterium]